MTVNIRSEQPNERAAVRAIIEAAFGQMDEAELIDKLQDEGVVLASFVATQEERLIGHILFSRMWIDTDRGSVQAVALAPLAVIPDQQRRGVGGLLIRYGLDSMRACGERVVIVVGHPDYYPRFGFSHESARNLLHPFPPEVFMALELTPGALDGVAGTVRYASAFAL